jgi:uncharacterized protein (TIGR03663 family)
MKWMSIALLLILITGSFLRIPQLAERPMHHDEANQAYRFGILLEEGTYQYDAEDHHGPTLYYLTLPIAWLTGAQTFAETSEITYRLLPVFFGLLLILCTPLLRSGLGSIAILIAALLTALSPAMAYYSRFYIQEILLVFFTFLAIAAGWRTLKNHSIAWAVVCGVALGLMFATKETAIIAYAALFGAAVLCVPLYKNNTAAAPGEDSKPKKKTSYLPLLSLVIGGALLTAFILYSSFFTHLDGPLESILAFKGYFARGSGINTDHVHPWNFYLKMLAHYQYEGGPVWNERVVLGLGILGCIAIALKKIPQTCNLGLARFLMFYTLLLTFIYSAIAYKTPWCMLSFLHGWILLAGIGMASVYSAAQRSRKPVQQQIILTVILMGLSFYTLRMAQRTVFRYAADYRNPYVYAHTAPDFKNLMRRIHDLSAVSPKGQELYIQVIADPDETWPLPFYLRRFPTVGYWGDAGTVPTEPKPDIIITAPDVEMDPEAYLSEFYGLRPDTLLAIHIDSDLWNAFLETRR